MYSTDKLDFCDIVLKGGIDEFAKTVSGIIGENITIIDNLLYICYPKSKLVDSFTVSTLQKSFYPLDIKLNENCYDYNERNRFCFAVGDGEARSYIIIENLHIDKLEIAVSVCNQASMALRYYFAFYSKSNQHDKTFEKNMVQYFFSFGSSNLAMVTKMHGMDIDPNRMFIVTISEIKDFGKKTNRETIRIFAKEFFKKKNKECIAIIDNDYLVLMLPQENELNKFQLDKNWLPPKQYANDLNKIIEQNFPVHLSTGIGTKRTLKTIHESYKEARIALTVPTFTGKEHYIQHYDDLGCISIIFSSCYSEFKDFSSSVLNKLFEHDTFHNTNLFQTLNVLIHNNFNRKLTANDLYIHVNTLKYRISKIEDILKIDMNNGLDTVKLYMVMLFYYTLQKNNWIEN